MTNDQSIHGHIHTGNDDCPTVTLGNSAISTVRHVAGPASGGDTPARATQRGTAMLSDFAARPWAIVPSMAAGLLRLAATAEYPALAMADGLHAARESAARGAAGGAGAGVQVIPIYGMLDYRPSLWTMIFGGSSIQGISAMLAGAMGDPAVGAIVLDIDSPGGSVYGVQELGDQVFAARTIKPIYAVANAMSASAAYWLGSQATRLSVTPSGEVGSIGVLALHLDQSRMLDSAGVTPSWISAGQYKTEGNELEPLADEARGAIQSRVDAYYRAFVGAVARGRGVEASAVEERMGQGRMMGAEDAKRAGMVDAVETFGATLARAAREAGRLSGRRTAASASLSLMDAAFARR